MARERPLYSVKLKSGERKKIVHYGFRVKVIDDVVYRD